VKKLSILAAIFAQLLWAGWSQAQPSFESKAEEAILMDATSGIIFYEKDADRLIEPASMSKLMTMMLVFEALKKGDLTLDTELPITEDAWRRGGSPSGGSTMYAELNSRVKVRDLMRGAMIQSANDACITFAEAIAGTEEAFAQRMTERGRELGLKEAVFKNATGLPDPQHLMSVRDLTVLARYIIQNFPDYYKIYSEREFTWNSITQQNRNPLLIDYPGADGMKTGYTKSAGYGLVGSVQRDGRRLLIVVAGLKSINDRKLEAQKLLDFGFRQFKTIDIYAAGETVSKARVWGGTERWVELKTRNAVRLALSPAEQARIEVKLSYKAPLTAPVEAGSEIGRIKFMLDGKAVAETPVETSQSVAESPSIWSKALDSLMVLTFGS
jgi:serine-type D-Ala-D-Ala carboxypeptidase (penicillin-binding protein 5/6)